MQPRRDDDSPPYSATLELSPTRSTTASPPRHPHQRPNDTNDTNDSFDISVVLDPHNTSMDPRQLVATSVEIFDLREQVSLMKEQVLDAQEESRRAKLLCVQVRKELHELTRQEETSQTYSAIASLLGSTTSLVEKFALFEQYLRESITTENNARDAELKADVRAYAEEQSGDVADGVRKVLESFRGRIESCNTAIHQEESVRKEECSDLRSQLRNQDILLAKSAKKQDYDELSRSLDARKLDCDDLRNQIRNQDQLISKGLDGRRQECDELRNKLKHQDQLISEYLDGMKQEVGDVQNQLQKQDQQLSKKIDDIVSVQKKQLDAITTANRQSADDSQRHTSEVRQQMDHEIKRMEDAHNARMDDMVKSIKTEMKGTEERIVSQVGTVEGKLAGSRQVGQDALDSVDDRCRQLKRELDAANDERSRDATKIHGRLSKIEEDSRLSDLDVQMRRIDATLEEISRGSVRQERDAKSGLEYAISSLEGRLDRSLKSSREHVLETVKEAVQTMNNTAAGCDATARVVAQDVRELGLKLESLQSDNEKLLTSAAIAKEGFAADQASAIHSLQDKIYRVQEAAFSAQEREWKCGLADLNRQTKLSLCRLLLSANSKCLMGNVFTRWKARATGKIMRGALSKYHTMLEGSIYGQICSRERLLVRRLVGLLGGNRGGGSDAASVRSTPALHRLFNVSSQSLLRDTYRKLTMFASERFNLRTRGVMYKLGQEVSVVGEGQKAMRGQMRRMEETISKYLDTNATSLSPEERNMISTNPRGALQFALQRFFAGEGSLGTILRALLAHIKYFDQDQLRQDEDVKVLSDWVRVIDEEIRKVQRCVRPVFK